MASAENLAKSLDVGEQVKIFCDPKLESQKREDILKNLSGAVLTHGGQHLWLGTDELTAIERFTRSTDGNFSDHHRYEFATFIDDFDPAAGEVDIEGLDYDDGYLWMIGSHSSKRKKVEVTADKFQIEKKELKNIVRQSNRYLLARVPIDADGHLEVTSPQRAWLQREGHNSALSLALAEDEYLDLRQIIKTEADPEDLPGKEFYLYLPSKENGLDIEGLAVRGNKLWIGLRGPVLRGIALLLEIEVETGEEHELILKPMGSKGRLYKRHFLALDGLGIRELCFANNGNLLILAGPTMDLDGTHGLFALNQPEALADNSLSSLKNQQLAFLGEVPHDHKSDRAEGICQYGDGESILVVYDSPKAKRLITDEQDNLIGVHADIFRLPQWG